MKYFVPAGVVFALYCAFLIGFATRSQAQSPPVPEENLLALACQISTLKAIREGLTVTYCRHSGEDFVDGNVAIITATIKIPGYGKFTTTTTLLKSGWFAENWTAAPQG